MRDNKERQETKRSKLLHRAINAAALAAHVLIQGAVQAVSWFRTEAAMRVLRRDKRKKE